MIKSVFASRRFSQIRKVEDSIFISHIYLPPSASHAYSLQHVERTSGLSI